jgi:hypothetical protein
MGSPSALTWGPAHAASERAFLGSKHPVCWPPPSLQIHHPSADWSYDRILLLTDSSFLLRNKDVVELELKGQFIETQMGGAPALLFMGSVRLSCLEEMKVDVCVCGRRPVLPAAPVYAADPL